MCDIKCNNPNDNPNCKTYHKGRGKVCKSCTFYKGRKCICEYCKSIMEHKSDTYNRFCSVACYQKSGIHKGSGNYFSGGLSDKDAKKRSLTFKNLPKEEIDLRFQKRSKMMKQLWENDEYRNHQSDVKSKMIADGVFNPHSNHKSGTYYGEHYDSLWELAYMIKLDYEKKLWTKKHGIRIPYQYENKQHNYVPDFLIDGCVIAEVKPKALLNYNGNDIKVTVGVEYGLNNNMEYILVHYSDIIEYIKKAEEFYGRETKK